MPENALSSENSVGSRRFVPNPNESNDAKRTSSFDG